MSRASAVFRSCTGRTTAGKCGFGKQRARHDDCERRDNGKETVAHRTLQWFEAKSNGVLLRLYLKGVYPKAAIMQRYQSHRLKYKQHPGTTTNRHLSAST